MELNDSFSGVCLDDGFGASAIAIGNCSLEHWKRAFRLLNCYRPDSQIESASGMTLTKPQIAPHLTETDDCVKPAVYQNSASESCLKDIASLVEKYALQIGQHSDQNLLVQVRVLAALANTSACVGQHGEATQIFAWALQVARNIRVKDLRSQALTEIAVQYAITAFHRSSNHSTKVPTAN